MISPPLRRLRLSPRCRLTSAFYCAPSSTIPVTHSVQRALDAEAASLALTKARNEQSQLDDPFDAFHLVPLLSNISFDDDPNFPFSSLLNTPAPSPTMAPPPPNGRPPKKMPLVYSNEVPRFRTDPVNFETFWHEVECLGRAAAISEKEMMQYAIRYAGRDSDVRTWKPLIDDSNTLAEFKESVTDFYLELSLGPSYSKNDLYDLVDNNYRIATVTRASASGFYREFSLISNCLLEENRINKGDLGSLYLEGYSDPFACHVRTRLYISHPDLKPTAGYPLKNVHEAVKWVLTGFENPNASDPHRRRSDSTRDSSRDDPSPSQRLTKNTKDIQSILTAISALTHAVSTNHSSLAPFQSTSIHTPGVVFETPRQSSCHFCSGKDHFIYECNTVEKYLRTGGALRNDKGKLTLPNGRYPPRETPGNNLREQFDFCLAALANRQQSANFFEGHSECVYSIGALPFDSSRHPSRSRDDNAEVSISQKPSKKPNPQTNTLRQTRSSTAYEKTHELPASTWKQGKVSFSSEPTKIEADNDALDV